MTFEGFAEDIDAMMAGPFGRVITHGSDQTNGIVDEIDVEMLNESGASVVGKQTAVHIRTGSLPGIASQEKIKINGAAYTVVAVAQQDDGMLTRLLCRAD